MTPGDIDELGIALGGPDAKHMADAPDHQTYEPEPQSQPDRAGQRAVGDGEATRRAAEQYLLGQRAVNLEWEAAGLPVFDLGIGLSTGDVAAAFLGSEERAEYTVIGDAVNLCQRLQQFASHGQIVLSEATWAGLTTPP